MNHLGRKPEIIDLTGDVDGDDWNIVESQKCKKKIRPTRSLDPPCMIVLCGIPGSGKSHLASALTSVNPDKYVRICQDVLGTRPKCEKATREALSQGKVPVIDRCNFSPLQRESFLLIATECDVPVDCIIFQYSQQECLRRCEERSSHETLNRSNARGVVSRLARQFDPPSQASDAKSFRSIKRVSSFHESNVITSEYLLL
eukprot:scaffold2192_cov268-Chaetoceros_neogracile.AAC.65